MCWLNYFTVGFHKTDCDSLLAGLNVGARRGVCSQTKKKFIWWKWLSNSGKKLHTYWRHVVCCIWQTRQIRLHKMQCGFYPEHYGLGKWFPTFFDAFLPLLILELFIPLQYSFHSSLTGVLRLLLTTIGTMIFIDDNHLINKSGTKTICCQLINPLGQWFPTGEEFLPMEEFPLYN